MACYKARGFLQKAESLGLTALGVGQTMLGLRERQREAQYLLHKRTFKARRSGEPFCLHRSAPTLGRVLINRGSAALSKR